jgi:hypothetical protein
MNTTPCYVAYCKQCRGMIFASVDKPEYAKDNAKEVAALIRRGIPVSKATVDDVRAAWWCENRGRCK